MNHVNQPASRSRRSRRLLICAACRNGYTRTHNYNTDAAYSNNLVVTAPSDGSTLILKFIWATGYGSAVSLAKVTLSPTTPFPTVRTRAILPTGGRCQREVAARLKHMSRMVAFATAASAVLLQVQRCCLRILYF